MFISQVDIPQKHGLNMAYTMLLYINGFYLIGVTEDDFPVKIRVIFRVNLLIYQRVIIYKLK